jgi:hypothetical protein
VMRESGCVGGDWRLRGGRRQARAAGGVALVLVAVLTGLGAGFASPGTAGTSSASLGSSVFPGYPAVAADGTQGFDAVWADRKITTAHWSAATRRWTPAVGLPGSVPGQWEPQVAASASGAAAIVWSQGRSSSPQDVEASYRRAGTSGWPSPVRLFSAGPNSGVSQIPQVGMDSSGDAFAAWATAHGLYVAEHPARAGSWSTPARVPHAGLQAFAVSSGGAAVAVWEVLRGGISSAARGRIYATVKPPGRASWLPAQDLGPAGNYQLQGDAWIFQPQPRAAINAHGTVFVVWQWPHNATFYPRVAILRASDDWRTPRSVAMPSAGRDPVIAADDHGEATVLWTAAHGIEDADLTPNGHVAGLRVLGPGGDARLVSNQRGDLAGVWSAAAVRTAGRHWCPQVHLKAAEDDWAVAISPKGVGQVVWEHSTGGDHGDVILAQTLFPCSTG